MEGISSNSVRSLGMRSTNGCPAGRKLGSVVSKWVVTYVWKKYWSYHRIFFSQVVRWYLPGSLITYPTKQERGKASTQKYHGIRYLDFPGEYIVLFFEGQGKVRKRKNALRILSRGFFLSMGEKTEHQNKPIRWDTCFWHFFWGEGTTSWEVC